jgi:hypothetical protein
MNLTYDALQEALARIENTTPTERALIEALEARYVKPFPEDRSHLDQAYADAMRQAWERFPDDPDVGFLFAESLMILSPWALYDRETLVPTENTGEIVATLERVFELNPNHPGACHAYIHAVEQSATPERALPAADRLCELTPGIPHTVHMPSHIYLRTDQWDRAVEQNLLAAEADELYFGVRPVRTFDYASNIHNNHIAAWSAMMTGREEIAIRTSRKMWDSCPDEIRPIAFAVADSWMCSLYDEHADHDLHVAGEPRGRVRGEEGLRGRDGGARALPPGAREAARGPQRLLLHEPRERAATDERGRALRPGRDRAPAWRLGRGDHAPRARSRGRRPPRVRR